MNCMSYFPNVFKREHIKEIREYISQIHARPFDEVFIEIMARGGSNTYSQFSIMCTYLFWKRREDYSWKLLDDTPDWDGYHPPPIDGHWGDKSLFTPEMFTPIPRVATHVRYRGPSSYLRAPVMWNTKRLSVDWNVFDSVILRGACHSPPLTQMVSTMYNCSKYLETTKYYPEMFTFEFATFLTYVNESVLIAAYNRKIERETPCTLGEISKQEFSTYFLNRGYSKEDFETLLITNTGR